MERKLASIRKISEIWPIEGSDFIELARINGWNVVVKKGEFQVNDFCIYCEIDSILPEKEPFEFLKSKKYRIKTQKIRGVLSQGIAFPLNILWKGKFIEDKSQISNFKLGDEITDIIGIKKYEPKSSIKMGGEIKSKFIEGVPKTDAERIQNLTKELIRWQEHNLEFIVTEKLDGTSSTFAYINGEYNVCSRNLNLKEDDENIYWKISRKYNIQSYIEKINKNIAIQGEIIGPGIQKNKYDLKEQMLYLFSIFDYDNQKYLDWSKIQDISNYIGIPIVPIIFDNIFIHHYTIDELIKNADGKSKINKNVYREGLIYNCFNFKDKYINIRNPLGRILFKTISNKFLLKYD